MTAIRRRKIFYDDAVHPQEHLSRYSRSAVIQGVRPDLGTCTLRWLDNPGGRQDVPLLQGSWGEFNMPIKGAVVIVQMNKSDQPRIVRYANLNQASRVQSTSDGGLGTLPSLKEGEKYWESVAGSYIYMTDSGFIRLVDQYEDYVEVDPELNQIKCKSMTWQSVTEGGTHLYGVVRRWVPTGENSIITDNIPTTTFTDGTPLTELNLTVNEKQGASTPVFTMAVGTVVESDGKVKDKDGILTTPMGSSALALRLKIQTSAGSLLVTVDKSGKIYVTSPRIVEVCPDIRLGSEGVTEPAVLGDVLKSKLESLIDAIKVLTVPTAFGPSGTPINAATFTSIKSGLSDILSHKVKLE